MPDAGWRYASHKEMQRQIKLGLVEFRDNHTEPPFRKAHIRPISEELEENDSIEEASESDEEEFATQVRGTYFYKQSQVAVKGFRVLMGANMFDNPKDQEEIARLFKYVCNGENNPIVMDFFAGSGSTAEAVLRLNLASNPGMRFITVQLHERCNSKEKTGQAALKAGMASITDIARERIRRVIKFVAADGRNVGFRAFKLAASNIRRWKGLENKTAEDYARQLEVFADTLIPGWKAEDVVWEVAIREGYTLTAKIEKLNGPKGGTFWRVTDTEKDQAFTICLDDTLTLDAVRALRLAKDDLFVCRDIALDDTLAANLALQCRLKVL